MTILLLGVSNVGKSITGQLLAQRLDYDFYDLDEEVKKLLGISLEEFTSTGTLYERDKIRCSLIHLLLGKKGNKVIAITPLSYIKDFRSLFFDSDILSIELVDSAENIFDRLVFSDKNDNIYKDDDYKSKHKAHYLAEIREDLKWYSSVYADIKHQFNISARPPKKVVDLLISEYNLDRKET
jgi:shikimate kinase